MEQVAEAAALPERHLYTDSVEVDEDEDESAPDAADADPTIAITDQVPFKEFVGRLVEGAKIYSELVLVRAKSNRINRHLRNLRMIKAVQTYGFLMHLRAGGCSDKNFRQILKLTEAFVLRRHICRERANETEALFARLCAVDPNDPIGATKEGYRELCPSDSRFAEEFASVSFPSRLIDRARYCLERLEISKHGSHDELQVLGADDVHVEHVIPQKIKTKKAKEEFGDWLTYLGSNAEAQHGKYVSRIGNLTLFAGTLNISASNSPFGRKRPAYKKSSILLTQDLAELPNFKFKTVDERSRGLASAAVALWPTP